MFYPSVFCLQLSVNIFFLLWQKINVTYFATEFTFISDLFHTRYVFLFLLSKLSHSYTAVDHEHLEGSDCSSWVFDPWQWDHCVVLQCWKSIAHWYSVISLKNGYLSCNTAKTWKLPLQILASVWNCSD